MLALLFRICNIKLKFSVSALKHIQEEHRGYGKYLKILFQTGSITKTCYIVLVVAQERNQFAKVTVEAA